MRPRRPLRSVFLGNPRYLSVYALGVAQAMGILGHWHRSVSLYDPYPEAEKQIDEMAPDVIWTHMALWPPANAALDDEAIASLVGKWRHRGACVFLHDGDPRERTTGVDVRTCYSIALVNRSIEEGHWSGLPAIRWPYAAMVQREIPEPIAEWACDLMFAGHLRDDEIYGERTALVMAVKERLEREGKVMRVVCPGAGDVNNRMMVADVAASAGAVMGFARPAVRGWIDTRVFQITGAGGLLIHDDAGEFLRAGEHYLRFDRANAVDSIVECVARAREDGVSIRSRAFSYIQRKHTWVQRVEQALGGFYGGR